MNEECKTRLKKIAKCAAIIAGTILFVWIVIYNICCNDGFWKASAVNCISIATAIIVSYYFVQRQTNLRKQKDILLELVLKFQAQITSNEACFLDGQSKEVIMMRKRDFSNKINIIKRYSSLFEEKDVEFIVEKFREYDTLIGDHLEDMDYLSKSTNELRRPLDLIGNKLYDMALHLYD